MNPTFSNALTDEIAPLWDRMLNTRIVRALVTDEQVTNEALQVYLLESYHYAKHNAQHQATVVYRANVCNREFMREALRHALEEVDHDQLALRDLERSGLDRAAVEQSLPLPETLAFSAFMYDWTMRYNPIGRLGYSLWAENTHDVLPAMIERIKTKFDVRENRAISFFTAHAVLDRKHGQEARDNIDRFAVTPDDRHAVRVVAHTSLKLFINLLEAMYDHYLQVRAGAPLLRLMTTA